MSWRLGAPLLAVVALLVAVPAASVGAAPHAAGATGPTQPAAAEPAPANATYEIQVRSDGDARITVTTWFALDDETDRETFRQVADRFESGEYSDLGLSTFRAASAVASQRTGRDMSIREEARITASAAEIENGTGRLAVAFTWTNFAQRPDNGTLMIGDAFETGDGTWFSGLEANQSLVIKPPGGYRVTSSTVPITNDSLRWEGPENFDPETLSATFVGGSGPGPGEGFPWPTAVVLLAVVLGIALFARTRLDADRDWLGRGGTDAESAEASEQGPPADEADSDSLTPESDADAAADAGAEDVDVELLSDEERVERLLDRNGGRMKQANIVKETGWSNAKVSQLLSAMEEQDRIDKLRIGRENLISFPDEDVTDVEN